MGPGDRSDRAARGLHAHWRTQCDYIAGAETDERDGLLITATNLPDATLNVAFLTDPVTHPDETLDWFVHWFRERGLRPGIELRAGMHPVVENALARRGFGVVVRRPAMTLHPLRLRAAAQRIDVRTVTGLADLAAFQRVQADVFDLAPDVAAQFLPWRAVGTPGLRFLLASADGVPCATAGLTMSEHGAGIVGVATLPGFRRRGLGRAATMAALDAGAELGADLAWLYPTAMARRMYEGLGFVTHDDVEVWVDRVDD